MENFRNRTLFDNSACVHNDNVVRHFRNNAQIVRDKQNRAVNLVLQIVEQIENLRLNGNVERRRRLVRDDKARLASKRHCNHNTLAHTTRQFMRVRRIYSFRHSDTNEVEHFNRTLLCKLCRCARNVQKGYFVKLITDGEYGIQRGHGFLEYHRHLTTSQLIHFLNGHLCDVVYLFLLLEYADTVCIQKLFGLHKRFTLFVEFLIALLIQNGLVNDFAVFVLFIHRNILPFFVQLKVADFETDRAFYNLSRRALQKTHNGHRGYRFTATRFPYDANRRVGRNVEGNAVYRLYNALVGKEVGMQPLYFQNVALVFHFRRIFGRVCLAVFRFLKTAHFLTVFLRNRTDFTARQI